LEIKEAVEKAFRVKVDDVRTMICRGRYFRKQMKLGAPKHWKKALVKLKQGEKISIFEGA
jgi:large subunit ribosomal protein L23